MIPGLAQRLREGTQVLHTQAERAGIMPALLKGSLPRAGLALLQRNLHALYAVLEPRLQGLAPAHGSLAAWADPRLARCGRLADDLCLLHGADWAAALPLLPATSAYASRLQQQAEGQPLLLAAHAYVRYLGDLAGGQALGRIVRRSHGLPGDGGAGFFDFGPPEQVAALAGACRQALNQLPHDLGEAMVAEAQWAFQQHVLLFEQLAAHGLCALGGPDAPAAPNAADSGPMVSP